MKSGNSLHHSVDQNLALARAQVLALQTALEMQEQTCRTLSRRLEDGALPIDDVEVVRETREHSGEPYQRVRCLIGGQALVEATAWGVHLVNADRNMPLDEVLKYAAALVALVSDADARLICCGKAAPQP